MPRRPSRISSSAFHSNFFFFFDVICIIFIVSSFFFAGGKAAKAQHTARSTVAAAYLGKRTGTRTAASSFPTKTSALPSSSSACLPLYSRKNWPMSATSSSAASSGSRGSSKHEDKDANAADNASAVNATVNLLELAAAAVACTVTASRKITALSSLYKDSNMNARLKSDGSFVTDADFAAQGAIVQAIQRVSQHVRIVGEESAEEMAAHIDDEDDAEDVGSVDNDEDDDDDDKADHDDDDGSGGDNDAPGDDVAAAAHAASATTTNKGRKRRLQQKQQQQLEQQQKRQQQSIIDRDILERTRSEVRYRLFYQKSTPNKKDGLAGEGGADGMTILPLSPAPPSPPSSTTTATTAESTTTSNAPAATPFVPLQFSSDDPDDCTVDASRVSVIVDPLDGTKSYAHGDYDAVSILVGIVVDNVPIFGVVGKPFGYTGLPPIRDTGCVTICGGSLLGGVYVAGRLEPIVRTPIRLDAAAGGAAAAAAADTDEGTAASSSKADAAKAVLLKDLPRAVISSSRSEGVVQDFCLHLGDRGLIDPVPLLISGAGEKSLRLILQKNNEALWFFPKGGTSRWDVAAPDALLRSLGGRMSDKNGNDLDYSTSRDDAENVDGIVACIDAELHAECIRLFGEGDWGTRK
jgi:3'-phosphoadenosine 5'-phosphosulfate (PAPS) 3'-phosphatase